MSIKKIKSGKWKLDKRPFGSDGPRVRGLFSSKKEAQEHLDAYLISYSGNNRDFRRLSDLVDLWYEYHGSLLKDAKYRVARMRATVQRLNNPCSFTFSASDFSKYRKLRLKSVSIETVNHETRYFRAMFNELINLGFWESDNPLKGLRIFPVPERELSFLTDNQIKILLKACSLSGSAHLLAVVKLALNTGARWNEANGLLRRNLLDDRVRFINTKNGKNRVVPCDPLLVEYLRSVSLDDKSGRCFLDCLSSYRRVIDRSSLQLPRGQLTHVLRHTYASHFVMNGGDIASLQKILGHSDIKITMRYAHLSPDFLDSARRFAPKLD